MHVHILNQWNQLKDLEGILGGGGRRPPEPPNSRHCRYPIIPTLRLQISKPSQSAMPRSYHHSHGLTTTATLWTPKRLYKTSLTFPSTPHISTSPPNVLFSPSYRWFHLRHSMHIARDWVATNSLPANTIWMFSRILTLNNVHPTLHDLCL